MKIDPETCDPTVISRFLDGELDPKDCESIKEHLCNCVDCEKLLEDLNAIARHVREHIENRHPEMTPATIERHVIESIRKRKSSRWTDLKDMLAYRKGLIPVAALASLILVFSAVFWSPESTGPSAIITSLSGDTSSVIIMETPVSGHTILWFTESS
jgi:anti-sigma factor RsiW